MQKKDRTRVRGQNRNARIETFPGLSIDTVEVHTVNRDVGTLEARVDASGYVAERSLRGLSIKTAGGRNIRFSGHEARTLYRLLRRAVNG